MGKAGKVGRPGRSPRSPLAFFVQACRTELRRRHPEVAVSVDALSRACAQRWQSTSAQERALFEHLAQACRRGALKPRPNRDPLAPKRPLSAFFLFSSEQRPSVRARWPGLNYAETAKRLGEHWAALSREQRQPFEARAVVLRQSYRTALAAYQRQGAAGGGGEAAAVAGGPAAIKVEAHEESTQGPGAQPHMLGTEEGHSWGLVLKEEGHSWGIVPEVEGPSWGTKPKAEMEGPSWGTEPKEEGRSWGTEPKVESEEAPSWGTVPKAEGEEGPSWGTVPKDQSEEGYKPPQYPLLGPPLEELKEEENPSDDRPQLWVRSGGQLTRKKLG